MQNRPDAHLRFLFDDIRLSAKALASLRAQLALAMLLALSVVLSYFGGFYLTQDNKIATSFLAMALAGYLYGPVPAALVGALTDIIQYILRPAGPFSPAIWFRASSTAFCTDSASTGAGARG